MHCFVYRAVWITHNPCSKFALVYLCYCNSRSIFFLLATVEKSHVEREMIPRKRRALIYVKMSLIYTPSHLSIRALYFVRISRVFVFRFSYSIGIIPSFFFQIVKFFSFMRQWRWRAFDEKFVRIHEDISFKRNAATTIWNWFNIKSGERTFSSHLLRDRMTRRVSQTSSEALRPAAKAFLRLDDQNI